MKQFLSWVGKKAVGGIVTGIFLVVTVLGVVYASIAWPSGNPWGSEVTGGKFMQYFNSIKVACPAGQYLNGYDTNFNKVCATAPEGPTGPQWPAGVVAGNCRQVTVSGSAPSYVGIASCNSNEYLLNGWWFCENKFPVWTMHSSAPYWNSWVADCFNDDNSGENIATAIATCCSM